MDSLFSSQKQRNVAEAKKAQIIADAKKKEKDSVEAKRVAQAGAATRDRIEQENAKIEKIKLTQKLELERRKNDLGREEALLAETLRKAKSHPVGSCLSLGFFPWY